MRLLALLLVSLAVMAQTLAPAPPPTLALARQLLESAAKRLQATPEFKDFTAARTLVEQLEKAEKVKPSTGEESSHSAPPPSPKDTREEQ